MSTKLGNNSLPAATTVGEVELKVANLDLVSNFYQNGAGLVVVAEGNNWQQLGVVDLELLLL